MRYLVLSDVHANLEALTAVLEASAGEWDQVLVLGDLVGYGGDPNAVIDRIKELPVTGLVRGNHDKVACGLDSVESFYFEPGSRHSQHGPWCQGKPVLVAMDFFSEGDCLAGCQIRNTHQSRYGLRRFFEHQLDCQPAPFLACIDTRRRFGHLLGQCKCSRPLSHETLQRRFVAPAGAHAQSQ